MLKSDSDILYEIREVKYDIEPKGDLVHEQLLQLKEENITYEPFFHKRAAFEHEKEVRVLVDDAQRYQIAKMSSIIANWDIHETMQKIPEDERKIDEIEKRLKESMGHWIRKETHANIYRTIKNLNKYISAVKVHPMAEKWYVELIKGLCEEQSIKFDGQSNLYGKAEKIQGLS